MAYPESKFKRLRDIQAKRKPEVVAAQKSFKRPPLKTYDYEPPAITEGKGVQYENCNVTACQKPKSAFFYNSVMHKYYCYQCAREIERFARMDGMSFYADLDANLRDFNDLQSHYDEEA